MKFENYAPGNGYRYKLALLPVDDGTGNKLLVWRNPRHAKNTWEMLVADIGAVSWINSDVLGTLLDNPHDGDLDAIQAWLKTKDVGGHKF